MSISVLAKRQQRGGGVRHGKPVVLEVAARMLEQHGHVFYLSENGVWLTDHVPPDYLNQRFDILRSRLHGSPIRSSPHMFGVSMISPGMSSTRWVLRLDQ